MRMVELPHPLAVLPQPVDEFRPGRIPRRDQLQGADFAATRIQRGVDGSQSDFRNLLEDFIPAGNQAPCLPTFEVGWNRGGLAERSLPGAERGAGRRGSERRDLFFAGRNRLNHGAGVHGTLGAILLDHRHDEVSEARGNPQLGGIVVQPARRLADVRQEPLGL